MKYQQVMKRMLERTRMALLSLTHPGCPEITLSMPLFLCSSFTDKLSCIHNYMHHSCTPPHIDIGTNFFILHLRDALLSGKNNLQKQRERGKSRRKREQPLMMMLWRTWFLVLTKMGLQAAALLLGKMTMQIIIHLQNKNASRSTEQKG